MGAFIPKTSLPVARTLPIVVGQMANLGSSRGLVEAGRSFGQILRQTQPVATKLDKKSVPPQLLALLASGMPLSTIVNQVAQSLAGKIANAISHGTQHAIDNVSKNKLLQAFASALAPPGGSPPGSNAEQAQTLAQQLQQLVANLAGGAAANAGQQNRFAGQILDAISAKENPAQQQSEQPGSSDAVSASFIESVLADAVAQLQASASGNSASNGAVQTMPVFTAPQLAEQQAVKAAPSTLQTTQTLTQSQSQTQSQPGDILGRIIARAAISSARFDAPVATANAAIAAPASKTTPLAANPAGDAQPSAVRASLDSLVAAIVDGARSSGGNTSGNGNFGGQNSNLFNLGQFGFSQLGTAKLASLSSDGTSFAQQTNVLTGPLFQMSTGAQAAAMPLGPAASYTTVDPNAIIEQVIKGMQVRNLGPDNSEMRMRLSPENLGDVSVKLSMSGGNLSASITAQSADVRDVLLANQNQLHRSLADAGLKLQNFSVNVSGGGAQGFGQHHSLGNHGGARQIAFHMGNSDDPQDDVLPATPTFGPPLAAVQTLGLLNYLA